jgi:hypothetical protein
MGGQANKTILLIDCRSKVRGGLWRGGDLKKQGLACPVAYSCESPNTILLIKHSSMKVDLPC